MANRIIGVLLLLGILAAFDYIASAQQTITLYAPENKERTKHSEAKSWFNFQFGVRGNEHRRISNNNWDLGYGFLAISNEDWFTVSLQGNDSQSVIKDLGKLDWSGSFEIPKLAPLPVVEKGKSRQVIIDSSGQNHKAWAESNGISAKAVVGHMYLVRIKRTGVDFYVLFRLESLEQQDNCTISWKLIPAPEQ